MDVLVSAVQSSQSLLGHVEWRDCPQVTFSLKLFQQMQKQSYCEVLSSEVLSEEWPTIVVLSLSMFYFVT